MNRDEFSYPTPKNHHFVKKYISHSWTYLYYIEQENKFYYRNGWKEQVCNGWKWGGEIGWWPKIGSHPHHDGMTWIIG